MSSRDQAGSAQRRTSQRGGAVKSFLFFIGGLGLLAAIALGVGGYLGYREAVKPGPLRESAIVLLPQGSAVSTIAHQLEDKGVIEHPEIFIAAVRLRGVQSEIKAGEYEIPARSSVIEIIDQLREGKSILHYFTAPEGRTTAQIIRLLNENEVLEGDITIEPGEGELLPETFAFTRGETRDNLVRRMMKDQDALIDALWDGRAMELPFSTPAEAIILASIVEKETGVAEERPRIAAVFVNRLKKGMRLESDPTIIYGLTGGEPLGRGIRLSELRGETPYNTYVIRGLPPTPIANPGEASIAAVLNPAETDDLFFVADGTGGHAFAATLREHQANVSAWRRVERDRAAQGGR
ncbi:endolytic transglycosylase MltG [Hyphococcus sp.]|uniref:endolytic transglycosylase MltG n=1 Tax=Hyphococcus sp. TaxID=2038636 RepID=UPI0035C772A4